MIRENRRKKHPLLRFILGLVLFLCVIYTVFDVVSNSPEVGHFRSLEGRQTYEKYYDEVIENFPEGYNSFEVNTSWGIVRLYEWKNSETDIPVILIPGFSSGSPMWVENIEGFSEERTVYALDALGDAGKSVHEVPFKGSDDVHSYIIEMMNEMSIRKAHIVGHSFGGGIAANFAYNHPNRVQTLTLLEPAFALNYPSVETMFWATVSSIKVLPKEWRDLGLSKISGEDVADVSSNDSLALMIATAGTEYSAEIPTPGVLSKKDLSSLEFPVYVAIAENSPITGDSAFKNASEIPNATVKIWKNTTHSLSMEVKDELADELNNFWDKNE